MSDQFIFKSKKQATCVASLLNEVGISVTTHTAKKGMFEKAKDWLNEKFTGFKKFDLDGDSSAISYIRYNKKKKILEVKFMERGKYQYMGVPESDFLDMMKAPSKGAYLNKKIKNRYNFKRLSNIRIAKKLSQSTFIGRILAKENYIPPDQNK